MQVKDLIRILEKCNGEDEVTFIFDTNERLSVERETGLFEVSQIDVTALKINGKIPLTNGSSHKLIKEDAESIFK